MCAAILFVALLAGSSSGLRTHKDNISPEMQRVLKDDVQKHIFVPEAADVCFESSDYKKITQAVSFFRAGPLAKFSPRSKALANISCAMIGATKLVSKQDSCFPDVSIYTWNERDVNNTLNEIRARNLRDIHAYADHRNISYEEAMAWTVCNGGCYQSPQEGFRWWGADRAYNMTECTVVMETIVPILEYATPKVGSWLADSGAMCWEGPFDYMEKTLANVKRTPAGDLFKNSTVKPATCSSLGYDKVRDPRDECWQDASKMTRRMMEYWDIYQWVLGPSSSFRKMMPASDTARGYPKGTSLDLVTCNCEKGGAARDRGMWLTMNNEGVVEKYTDEFCKDLNSKYLGAPNEYRAFGV